MSHQRFGSQRARLILSGVGAVSLIAVLCAQWLLAEFRRMPPNRAAGDPAAIATLPPAPPSPVAPATSGPEAVGAAPRSLDRVAARPTPARPDDPAPAELGPSPAVPTAADRPNVDQTAAIRTETRPIEPGDEAKAPTISPAPSQGGERRPPPTGGRAAPAPAGGVRAAQMAETPAPSTGLAPQPAGRGSGPPPGSGPEAPAEPVGLQAVIDQIAQLRHDVHRVGEGVTKLREDVRADITRLEGKVQALEPRRAGEAPSRTKREVARTPIEGGIPGSAAPGAVDASPRGSNAPGSRAPAAGEPQAPDSPGAQAAASPSQVLRRPSLRARGLTRTQGVPKRAVAPGTTAGLEPAPVRTTIRRSAGASRPATKDRGVMRLAAAGSARGRPVEKSTPRGRWTDHRYASFRTVEMAPGRPSPFRSARRSLRYRPIAECVP